MSDSFEEIHSKTSFLFHEGCRIGTKEKDYLKAINLIEQALKIVQQCESFPKEYKSYRCKQFSRWIQKFSLKAGKKNEALYHAKKSRRPDLKGDVYFELRAYRECLNSYTKIEKNLIQAGLRKRGGFIGDSH